MSREPMRILCLAVGLLLTAACGEGESLSVSAPPLRLAPGRETRLTVQVQRAGITGDFFLRVSGLPDFVEARTSRVLDTKDTALILFRVVDTVPAGTQVTARIEVFNAAGQRAATDVPVAFDVSGGAVDPSFGVGGSRSLPTPDNLGVCGAATTPDGQLVLARAYPSGYEVSWLDEAGTLLHTTPVPEGRSYATAGEARCGLAVASDGAIWLSGTFATDDFQLGLLVTRLLPDGSRDPGFGRGGVLLIDPVPSMGSAFLGTGDLFVLPDGRALVSGLGQRKSSLLRLLPDGTRDGAFGEDGWVFITTEGAAPRLFPLPDGRFLTLVQVLRPQPDSPASMGRYPAVLRFLPDGRRDPSYGAGDLNPGLEREGGTVAGAVLEPDGALLLSLRHRGELLRLTPAGSLDRAWGTGGYRKLQPLPGMITQPPLDVLVRLEDGRIASADWGSAGKVRVAFVFTLQPDGTVTPTSREGARNAAFTARPSLPLGTDPNYRLERPRWLFPLPGNRGLLVSDLLEDRRDKEGRWPVVTDLHLARFFL
ncbi:hypothetical protein D7W79_40500 [Corallococcus exercitus]|uniref:hypothetical protein n=1 Tax=Corallococcus exercitus TaxID=2316736 RepID=UPI000EA220C6|nr:hypothetical protein [Corallococcus exercitus]RKG63253.1 hypothetical protein D7W79_40500 [Corallococcus exercitus]